MDQGEASSDKAVTWTYWVDKGNSVHMTAFSFLPPNIHQDDPDTWENRNPQTHMGFLGLL